MEIADKLRNIEKENKEKQVNAIKEYLISTEEAIKERDLAIKEISKLDSLYHARLDLDKLIRNCPISSHALKNDLVQLEKRYEIEYVSAKNEQERLEKKPLTIDVFLDRKTNSILLPIRHEDEDNEQNSIIKEILQYCLELLPKSEVVSFNGYVEIKFPSRMISKLEERLSTKHTPSTLLSNANLSLKITYLDFTRLFDTNQDYNTNQVTEPEKEEEQMPYHQAGSAGEELKIKIKKPSKLNIPNIREILIAIVNGVSNREIRKKYELSYVYFGGIKRAYNAGQYNEILEELTGPQ